MSYAPTPKEIVIQLLNHHNGAAREAKSALETLLKFPVIERSNKPMYDSLVEADRDFDLLVGSRK